MTPHCGECDGRVEFTDMGFWRHSDRIPRLHSANRIWWGRA